ncbi:MAG: alkaline phosphatase family protein [Lysobacterales bacterium]|jgi:predicted AlkP superfamily pyrophosphatase or phosphodiesterase
MQPTRTRCRIRPAALLSLAALLLCGAGPVLAAPTPKAVFIIIDGVPADVIERVATPNIDSIAAAGGYTHAYVGGEIGGPSQSPTVSAPGYMDLITGTWCNKHNVYDNEVANPDYDYWNIFRIAEADDPGIVTAVFSTWEDNRTKLIGEGLPQAGNITLDYHFDGLEKDTERYPPEKETENVREIDGLVADDAERVIRERGPDLSWVYLQYTDDVAHEHGDSPEFDASVRLTDQRVGQVWQAVQARQAGHDEDWLIIVTTDHGRDATGKGHGQQSERERTTWIVTNSHRLNAHFHDRPAIVDILPSLVTHFGLHAPDRVRARWDGQSFID